jgi:diaminohydroxyphosphoribosylaminopyrimidine deaminase/5-amino-6-(5-phosphoribosylamino)uracil reductase
MAWQSLQVYTMTHDNPSTDSIFMQRALQLAALGRGHVSPNPLVGCVIVHQNTIIGEGWHRKYGGPHAEVNAIESVADKSLLKESTVYVTLEPCAHFGKTPPCADLLVKHHVKKVVVAILDSNPAVAGKGIQKLQDNGIEVHTGICEAEARALNIRFFTMMESKRPYIILKWAQTQDGFIARENFDSKWISNIFSRQLVHKWRSEEDAILVGTKTALYDNPMLNVRDWSGRDPVRIVIDKQNTLPVSHHLFDGSQPTLRYSINESKHPTAATEVILPEQDFLQHLVNDLYNRKIQSVIVEGGCYTLQHFIDLGLWDEARIFTGLKTFGTGIAAPTLQGTCIHTEMLQEDTLRLYKRIA